MSARGTRGPDRTADSDRTEGIGAADADRVWQLDRERLWRPGVGGATRGGLAVAAERGLVGGR